MVSSLLDGLHDLATHLVPSRGLVLNPLGRVVKTCRLQSPPLSAVRFHDLLWTKQRNLDEDSDCDQPKKQIMDSDFSSKRRKKFAPACERKSHPVDICQFDEILAEHQDPFNLIQTFDQSPVQVPCTFSLAWKLC